MGKTFSRTTAGTTISRFVAAAIIYAAFAVYLYQPYLRNFHRLQYLFVVNAPLASLGCYLLSRRWVASFWSSFFAGAIYGFGPFTLGLASYHPTAGLLAAAIPWLFCPAAFIHKEKWQWLSWLLSTLPFLGILLFFEVSADYRLFAIPTQVKLQQADLAGLIAPLVTVGRSQTLVGFYHVTIASLIMGLLMLTAGRRFGIMIILGLGTVLAFCDGFLNVSPIIWLTIPVLCCSVFAGAGMQGLATAGFADRKYVLGNVVIMLAISIVMSSLARKNAIFAQTAHMYILGTAVLVAIFIMVYTKLHMGQLRLITLCFATAVDVFFSARFIIDKIF